MIPLKKAEELIQKHKNLENDLSSGNLDNKLFASKSKEYSDLNEIISNVKKYLDLHDKYITRSYMKDEWWSRKYHYEYWSNGVLFYPHQNKDFPSGSPF